MKTIQIRRSMGSENPVNALYFPMRWPS